MFSLLLSGKNVLNCKSFDKNDEQMSNKMGRTPIDCVSFDPVVSRWKAGERRDTRVSCAQNGGCLVSFKTRFEWRPPPFSPCLVQKYPDLLIQTFLSLGEKYIFEWFFQKKEKWRYRESIETSNLDTSGYQTRCMDTERELRRTRRTKESYNDDIEWWHLRANVTPPARAHHTLKGKRKWRTQ